MRSRSRGITLVEMLIVMGIMALLFALLMPAVASIKMSALRTQCSNRLHLLGTAYASRMQNPTPIVPDAYYNELAPYVENTAKVFVCPEVRSSLVGNNLKSFGVRVRSVSQVSGWNGTNIIPMEPGNGRCIMYVKSSPAVPSGAAAGAYRVAFEDSTDADYDDIILLIEQVPSGTRITVIGINGSYRFDLVDSQGIALAGMSDIGSNNYSGKKITLDGVGDTSFGINVGAASFKEDGSKVLLLDYNRIVANVLDSSNFDDWTVTVAPRHRSACNVLFVNGSVKSLAPNDIDPRDTYKQDAFWRPKADVLKLRVQ